MATVAAIVAVVVGAVAVGVAAAARVVVEHTGVLDRAG